MRNLCLALLVFYVAVQSAYSSSVTQFFNLNDEALDFILSETDSVKETSLDRIERSLRKYFESHGVVFSEHGSLNFDGEQIILVETKENREKIEGVCEELWKKFGGRVRPPYILTDFSHANISYTGYIDSYYESLSEVTLYWKTGRLVQIIVLNSEEFADKNIIYRQHIETHETRLGPQDPFKEPSGPVFYSIRFECKPDSLKRIFIGSRGPKDQLVRLSELMYGPKDVSIHPFGNEPPITNR